MQTEINVARIDLKNKKKINEVMQSAEPIKRPISPFMFSVLIVRM